MPATVNVNFRTVVHAQSSGVCMGFPDVCQTPTPAGPVPIPYPNIAMSQDTSMGSSTVTMDGQPIMLKDSCFATSTGDEAGSAGGGVASGVIKGKAEFILYSFDVMVEGKNVCRLADLMLLNTKNTPPFPLVQPPTVVLPAFAVDPKEDEAEDKDWSVSALDIEGDDDDEADEDGPELPPEPTEDAGTDAAAASAPAEDAKAAGVPGGAPKPAPAPALAPAKKLGVKFDQDSVRCGAEVKVQATSENIDGAVNWQIKQAGGVVASVAGTLGGGSAQETWNAKAQTNQKVEPPFSLAGSAGGVNAASDKDLTVKKYEDNASETKTIACASGVYGWTGKFDIELKDGQLTVTTKIKLLNREGPKPAAGGALPAAGAAVSDADKATMKADIEGKLSGQRLFHRDGCKRGDGCDCPKARGCCKIPVRVVVEFVETGEHHVVNLFQGAGRADSGNWTRVKTRDNSYAHETGHLLGFYDEYAGGAVGTAPRWKVQADVVMNTGLTVPAEYYWDFRDWLKGKCGGEAWKVLAP
jgi:hypothetical protein